MKTYRFEKTSIKSILSIITEHSLTLPFPWDSFTEQNLFKDEIFAIFQQSLLIGYASVYNSTLSSFYVTKKFYKLAPDIFADFLSSFKIKDVQLLTNDPLIVSLISEWDFEIKSRNACFFSDSGRLPKPPVGFENPLFRAATLCDSERIISATGDFFDKLEERISSKTIFILEDSGVLLGCGIIELGVIYRDFVSIGMITCKEHRKKGIAQTILWHLKEWVYSNGLYPIAGCWYYNVLSRKSLEASGMIPTGKSLTLSLIKKEQLPLRTGNPPGELPS